MTEVGKKRSLTHAGGGNSSLLIRKYVISALEVRSALRRVTKSKPRRIAGEIEGQV